MSRSELQVGIVGACGRGGSFRLAFDVLQTARIRAVCDVNADELPDAAQRLGADEQYSDYGQMLDRANLDAVILGTPMPFHVPQAIAALERGVSVLSEVPAGVSVDECRDLVRACAASDGTYMMAENYVYTRPSVIVREMVRLGWFGTPYYGEGEYLHELKELNEITRWRRKWQTGIDGVTYGTHSLGPLLQWMPGERVVEVCCAGSGHHYVDPRGDTYENQDSSLFLGKMSGGGLVKVRVDMLSERPHAMHNHVLQGTEGCYESARTPSERDRVWVRGQGHGANEWHDLAEFEEAVLPAAYRAQAEAAQRMGHGGGDFFVLADFVAAVRGEAPNPIGIHEAMDMTLPGLVSQQSVAEGGRWIEVPDSREWTD